VTQYATEFLRSHTWSARKAVLLTLGPCSAVAGFAWALFQPWRLTLLHPHGQGFWWLVVEPPLLVILAGVLFHVLVARPLVDDLEDLR